MWSVGVFEREETFLRSFRRRLLDCGLKLTALEAGESYDVILALSPGCPHAHASVAILPGEFPEAGSALRFMSAVTYGMSERDTVTASSVSERGLVISVRRDLISLRGVAVERQEAPFPLNYPLNLALPLASLMLISGNFIL